MGSESVATKKVRPTVEEKLLRQAMAKPPKTDKQSEAVRRALEFYVKFGPAGKPKPVEAMEPKEFTACLKFLVSSTDKAEKAIAFLEGKKKVAKPADRKRLRIQIADLRAEHAKLAARCLAFEAGRVTMAPPSDDAVKEIEGLFQEVKDMTKDAKSVDTMIATATAMARWS